MKNDLFQIKQYRLPLERNISGQDNDKMKFSPYMYTSR